MEPPEWDDTILIILALILMIIILTKTDLRAEDLLYLFRHVWYSANQSLISYLRQVEFFEDAVSWLTVIANDLVRLDTQLSPEAPIHWLQSVKVLQNRAEQIKVGNTKCAQNFFKKIYFAKKAGKEIKRARNLIVRGEYLLWWAQAGSQPMRDVLPQQPRDQPWGMDSYKKKVHDYIENKGTESQLLGICGMRGVGKTSLLRLVYDSYPDKAFFGHIMFIGAGSCRLSTVSTVQHAIAIKFGLDWSMMSTLDDLSRAMYIFFSLERKRFLLLLDDVEEPLSLKDIGLPIFSGRQQKIILATRNSEVCALMGCDRDSTIEMRCLGEVDAWNLFKDEVQNEIIDVHPQVHLLAKQMVAECHGLPIAICAIARAMSTKRDLKNWSNAHDLLKDKHSPTQMNEGYAYLDILRSELKNSFLVTSVWPKDGSIPWSTIKEDGITTKKEEELTQWLEKDVTIPWLKEDESVPWTVKNDGSILWAKKDEDASTSLSKKEKETIPWLQEDASIPWLGKDEDESTSLSKNEDETVPWLRTESGSLGWLQTEAGSLGWLQPEPGSLPWVEQKEEESIPWWLGNYEDESTSLSKNEDERVPWLQTEAGRLGWSQTLLRKDEDENITWSQKEYRSFPLARRVEDGRSYNYNIASLIFSRIWGRKEDGTSTSATKEEDGHDDPASVSKSWPRGKQKLRSTRRRSQYSRPESTT